MPQRKQFRIETFQLSRHLPKTASRANGRGAEDGGADLRHQEVMDAIRRLQRLIEPEETVNQKILDDYKSQIGEARKLKVELDEIYEAINRTKKELATLHTSGFQGPEMSRVTDELDAIVSGTEGATETILAAAEDIDQMSSTLVAKLHDAADQGLADDIQQRVIMIFEACNFQDLTGQRITKVVNTLRFIEDRIVRMMEIWGGMEGFEDIEPDMMAKPEGDAALLNGPALAADLDRASQDDIDALFG